MTSRRTLIKNLKIILYNTVKVVEEKKSEQLKQSLKTNNVILVTPKRKNAKNKNLPRKH
jgi:hypothetical protein